MDSRKGSHLMRKNVIVFFICLNLFIVREVSAENIHKVRTGDTFWKIAQQYHISLERLIKSNPSIHNPNLIFPGQEIVIPNSIREHKYKERKSHIEKRLLDLINEKRLKLGFKQLLIDQTLSNAAQIKSIDMKENGYVAHNSPTYGDANSMLKELKISFQTVKESIGAGHDSAEEIFSSWLNSPVNRANVLNKEATYIGIGYSSGGIHGHYWTILIVEK